VLQEEEAQESGVRTGRGELKKNAQFYSEKVKKRSQWLIESLQLNFILQKENYRGN
jgi:hypothetical protein